MVEINLPGLDNVLQQSFPQRDVENDLEEEVESNNPESWPTIGQSPEASLLLVNMTDTIDAASQVVTDKTDSQYRWYDHFSEDGTRTG
jgi:hypothetical protein